MVVIRSIILALLLAVVTGASNPDIPDPDPLLYRIITKWKKANNKQKEAKIDPDSDNAFHHFAKSNSSPNEQNKSYQLTGFIDTTLDKLKDLTDERHRIKTSFALFKKYLEPLLDTKLTKVQCDELILRHRKTHDLQLKFEELQNKIQSLDGNKDDPMNEREEIENLYFESVAHAQKLLQNCALILRFSSASFSGSSSTRQSSSRVPPLQNEVFFSAVAAGQSLGNTAFNFNFNLLNSQENAWPINETTTSSANAVYYLRSMSSHWVTFLIVTMLSKF